MTNNTTIPTLLDASSVGRGSSNPFVVQYQTRDPTSSDVQYPIQKIWLNTTTNNFWFLKNFTTSNGVLSANWIFFSYGNALGFDVDAHTDPGTDPVIFSPSGLITVTGGQVAAGTTTHVLQTDSVAANEYTIEIQRSQAVASPTVGDNGVSHYDSAHFSVDSTGYVQLLGGGQAIDSVNVDAHTSPGTNPVLPAIDGSITVTGGQVAAGTTTHVIRTDSLAVNTYTIEVQRSQAVASSTVGDNGVCHFSSSQFGVDSNGFVTSIIPSFTSVHVQTFTPAGSYTYTPTSGMKYYTVQVQGAGGGGGASGTQEAGSGSGGGAGGYCIGLYPAASVGSSTAVIVGAGGATGTTTLSGVTGGTSSFGSLQSATGGVGAEAANNSGVIYNYFGGSGGTATGGYLQCGGAAGDDSCFYNNVGTGNFSHCGNGGDSFFGGGGESAASGSGTAGGNGAAPGAGGGGGSNSGSGGTAGGSGADGVVIVTEYVL